MKKFHFIYLFIALVAFQSCNKIDGPYTTPVPAKEWYGKRILIEDYTGHKCPNCPAAAVVANDLKTLYGDKVVIISVHAGFFAAPSVSPFDTNDFTTTAGDAWNQFFGFQSYPVGMINRVGFPTLSHKIDKDAWNTTVSNMMTELPEVDITITPSYNPVTRKLSGQVTTKFLKTIKRKLKLQIVVTQDSVIAPQQNASAVITDYVHRHMLRAVNDNWGKDLTDGTTFTSIDTKLTQDMSIDFKTNWFGKNFNVVAFVYDDNTKEVLQVAEKEL
ncbi:MAG: Omp28 family outer membrane lipoprotein [Bacteroidetes bacterium]|nr:Omp28 family outer membrane lipoprotein [Bacteroidota bacterium]